MTRFKGTVCYHHRPISEQGIALELLTAAVWNLHWYDGDGDGNTWAKSMKYLARPKKRKTNKKPAADSFGINRADFDFAISALCCFPSEWAKQQH